jgi:hypothetical protein
LKYKEFPKFFALLPGNKKTWARMKASIEYKQEKIKLLRE